jgi:hypothetical protein
MEGIRYLELKRIRSRPYEVENAKRGHNIQHQYILKLFLLSYYNLYLKG